MEVITYNAPTITNNNKYKNSITPQAHGLSLSLLSNNNNGYVG